MAAAADRVGLDPKWQLGGKREGRSGPRPDEVQGAGRTPSGRGGGREVDMGLRPPVPLTFILDR